MKTEIKEIYKCEYCNKLYQRKHFAERHELMCYKNTETKRACFGCANLTKKEVLIYSGHDHYYTCEPVNYKMNFLFCNKKQIFLYTQKSEVKGNYLHIDENGNNFENNPMPKECELANYEIEQINF